MNTELRKDCPMRHENGNCLPAGGFCTAVNNPICEALHNAYDTGRRAAALRARKEAKKTMTLEEKIKKAETCIFHQQGRCSLNGYPPFDCCVCKSFKKKEAATYRTPKN